MARAIELVGLRWTLAIVGALGGGASRFSELRGTLGISSRVLSRRLHMLSAYGIVERRCYDPASKRFEYLLTESGHDLARIVVVLGGWGEQHLSPSAPVPLAERTGFPQERAMAEARPNSGDDGRTLSAA